MENEESKLKITQFFNHFRKVLKSFNEISVSDSNHTILIQKLMCCSLLDCLSAARFPKKSVSKRFKDFIKIYSNYEHWDKISLPQLYYKFENNPDSKFFALKTYVENIVLGKEDYSVQNDPIKTELIQNLQNYKKQIENSPDYKKEIENCSYLFLLYKYRNNLAHDMKEPGHGMESSEEDVPFYLPMTNLNTGRKTFELVYPVKFFFNICNECIHNLKCYFLKEGKSPYDVLKKKFKDAWQ